MTSTRESSPYLPDRDAYIRDHDVVARISRSDQPSYQNDNVSSYVCVAADCTSAFVSIQHRVGNVCRYIVRYRRVENTFASIQAALSLHQADVTA